MNPCHKPPQNPYGLSTTQFLIGVTSAQDVKITEIVIKNKEISNKFLTCFFIVFLFYDK